MGDEPHYHGHRKRLRKKFRESGKDAFHDYELLELLLTYAIPRGDVKPTAKKLIEKFDTLSNVLEADRSELMDVEGVGDVTATFFPLLKDLQTEYLAEQMEQADVLDGPEAVAEFARMKLGDEDREVFMAIFVDKQKQLIDYEILQKGTIDRANIYPRELVKSALNLNAKAFILVHNHPTGHLEPSEADLELTERLRESVETVDLELLDHLIVTRSDFKQVGSGI